MGYGIQKSLGKSVGKTFRKAKGIRIHGGKEPDIENRSFASI